MKLGKTGEFPLGKLNEDDEGALNIAIGAESGMVKVTFGSPVAWLAMPPKQAESFALAILAKVKFLVKAQQ